MYTPWAKNCREGFTRAGVALYGARVTYGIHKREAAALQESAAPALGRENAQAGEDEASKMVGSNANVGKGWEETNMGRRVAFLGSGYACTSGYVHPLVNAHAPSRRSWDSACVKSPVFD